MRSYTPVVAIAKAPQQLACSAHHQASALELLPSGYSTKRLASSSGCRTQESMDTQKRKSRERRPRYYARQKARVCCLMATIILCCYPLLYVTNAVIIVSHVAYCAGRKGPADARARAAIGSERAAGALRAQSGGGAAQAPTCECAAASCASQAAFGTRTSPVRDRWIRGTKCITIAAL